MTDSPNRDLKNLAAIAGVDLAPEYIGQEALVKIANAEEPLTCEAVDVRNVEGFGDVYELTLRRASGERFLVSMWNHAQRDSTCLALAQLTQDGPVTGVKLTNTGSGKKPFLLIQPT